VLNKIKEELQSLRTGEDFGWQRTALIEGLEKMERVLSYFPFFGHDAACKEFFAVNLELRTIYEREPGSLRIRRVSRRYLMRLPF
jgi:hypothetical protein